MRVILLIKIIKYRPSPLEKDKRSDDNYLTPTEASEMRSGEYYSGNQNEKNNFHTDRSYDSE